MSDLYDIEKQFDNMYNINELISNAFNIIESLKNDIDCAIYDDCNNEEIIDIRNSKVMYIGKEISINCVDMFPKFILKFMFEGINKKYLYDIEYNLSGELSDDYFEVLKGDEDGR